MNVRHAAAGVGLSMVLGAGAGVAIEAHTNDIARGKIITVEGCLQTMPQETRLSQAFVDCVQDGVPGGNKVDKHVLAEGQPAAFADSYIEGQRREAASIELGRVAAWSVAPIAVATAYGFFAF